MFLLLLIGIGTAAILYPVIHELSHLLCALVFGAIVIDYTVFPIPSVLCNVGGLNDWQLFLVVLSGPIIPFIIGIILKINNFWIYYIKTVIVLISGFSFVISIIGMRLNWEILTEQDDIVRFANLIPYGEGICFVICILGIVTVIYTLIRMKNRMFVTNVFNM